MKCGVVLTGTVGAVRPQRPLKFILATFKIR